MNRTQRREQQKALKIKAKHGLLPPQACPNCGADLSDKDVPEEYRHLSPMFGHAMEIAIDGERAEWRCPNCDHQWLTHMKPADLRSPHE